MPLRRSPEFPVLTGRFRDAQIVDRPSNGPAWAWSGFYADFPSIL